jgi:hypothetical protein
MCCEQWALKGKFIQQLRRSKLNFSFSLSLQVCLSTVWRVFWEQQKIEEIPFPRYIFFLQYEVFARLPHTCYLSNYPVSLHVQIKNMTKYCDFISYITKIYSKSSSFLIIVLLLALETQTNCNGMSSNSLRNGAILRARNLKTDLSPRWNVDLKKNLQFGLSMEYGEQNQRESDIES